MTDNLEDLRAGLKALREPFPRSAIDQLPRGGTKLDYLNHAQTTARLLDVDPFWTWEPFSTDEQGQPVLVRDRSGAPFGLWIRLTVCGVTRPGFGELPAAKGADGVKEAIGDAIRNAAMRFGVALDLWSKSDLAEASGVVTGEASGGNEPSASTPTPPSATPKANGTPDPSRTKTGCPCSSVETGSHVHDGSTSSSRAVVCAWFT